MRCLKPREACPLSQELKWEHMEPHGRILWKEVRYWPSADPAEAGGEEKQQEHLNQRVSHIIRLWSLGAEIFLKEDIDVVLRKTGTWLLLQGEHVRQESLQQQDIIWGKIFFSLFLFLLLLKKLWWKPNCVQYVRRGGGNEGRRRAEAVCGKVRDGGGLKAREDQKDKTSIPSHFHVFTLAQSLMKPRKINSDFSPTK